MKIIIKQTRKEERKGSNEIDNNKPNKLLTDERKWETGQDTDQNNNKDDRTVTSERK